MQRWNRGGDSRRHSVVRALPLTPDGGGSRTENTSRSAVGLYTVRPVGWRALALVAIAVQLVAVLAVVPRLDRASAAGNPAIGGRWSGVADWPFIPLSASLDNAGRVLTYGSTPDGEQGGQISYDVWDPEVGLFNPASHSTRVNLTQSDTFCAIAVNDSLNDRVLLLGGDSRGFTQSPPRANNLALTYDASDQSLRELSEQMKIGRWYPSATALPDGRIIIQGGSDHIEGAYNAVTTPEVYEPGSGFRLLSGARNDAVYGDGEQFGRWWYPRSWLTPAGKIFGISGSAMYYIDPNGEGSIQRLNDFPTDNTRATSAAVMYAPGKILQVGGGEGDSDSRFHLGSNKASIIDISVDPPVVTRTADMAFPRHWADATVLPDGKVLVTGGSHVNNELEGVAYAAEMWDPATGRWTTLESNDTARLYHSTALLLPDASLLIGGGGAPGPIVGTNAEIYEPPYLFAASGNEVARPEWAYVPPVLPYGGQVDTAIAGGRSIDRVTMIKSGSVTHSYNSEQRFLELDFRQSGSTLEVSIPREQNIAPPGRYLLFALDANGVPSEAEIIELKGDVVAPLQPNPAPTTTTTAPPTTTTAPRPTTTTTAPPPPEPDKFTPLKPVRVLDSRTGLGGTVLQPGETREFAISGVGPIPASGVAAVAVNVLAIDPTADGFLTVFPSNAPRPLASAINFVKGDTVANAFVASLDPVRGTLKVYNSNHGRTQVVVDVNGWFSDDSSFVPITPVRALDTRIAVGGSFTVGAGETIDVPVTGVGDVPLRGVGAVALNVTAVKPTQPGWLALWPSGVDLPLASSLNFIPGDVVGNGLFVQVGDGGRISIHNSAGDTDVVVDLMGWYPQGTEFESVTPVRVMDTRLGLGGVILGPRETRTIQATGLGDVPLRGVKAVEVNLTVVKPTNAGYVTAFSAAITRPLTSVLNFTPGEVRGNAIIVGVDEQGRMSLYNPYGDTHLVADITGYFPD